MFDIHGDDIARLDDADLRTLVARLAIAELTAQGAPLSSVTAGGHQDAPDGGIDVRVEAPATLSAPDFVPRRLTGFQVKKPDMPANRITAEMRPGGVLRNVIRELADAGGAYVIVSAQGSVADAPLKERKKAVKEALDGHPTAANLATDFYDRERLATWVNQYPGVAAWVRRKSGNELSGWGPVGAWVDTGVASDAGYITNDELSLIDERTAERKTVPIVDGVDLLRGVLARPGQAVRLIGLSGLGKTRFVQALFEPGVGAAAPLDPGQSVYTDYADDLRPSAREMARRLLAEGRRAILIVDNCNPATHTELAALCATEASQVSLLTVEYDVRDDEPDLTQVFRLAAGSQALVVAWIEREFPAISQLDRQRIAEFSDGNFRIARALASTVDRRDSLAQLRDQDLFARLFNQRHNPDGRLLTQAQTLSLVYSYRADDTGEGSELAHLSALADCTADDLYASTAELIGRGLVQSRGPHRAVLPHALANPLAATALARLAPARLDAAVLAMPARLLKSFTRRLGYLHESADARALLARWLAPGGPLENLAGLASLELVQNLAPIDPPALLATIEAGLADEANAWVMGIDNPRRYQWVSLLRSLAYEPALFDRAARVILRFVQAEPVGHNHNAAAPQFVEMFNLYLSGVDVPPDQRFDFVRGLLGSAVAADRAVGVQALESAMKVRHFSSAFTFEFGARPRSYGWEPRTNRELWDWYLSAIQLALDFDDVDTRKVLASSLRDLWMIPACHDRLEAAARRFAPEGWIEGWVGLRTALRFDGDGMRPEHRQRLANLIEVLEPRGHLERARAFVLNQGGGHYDVADGIELDPVEAQRRAGEEAIRIAARFVADRPALRLLVPEILASAYTPRAWHFGRGLADAAENLPELWETLIGLHREVPHPGRRSQILAGFIAGAQPRDPAFVSRALEALIGDAALAGELPALQAQAALDTAGVERLLRAIDAGAVTAIELSTLSTGVVREIADADLVRLLDATAGLDGGHGVALDILSMRFFVAKPDGPPITAPLVELGRRVLTAFDFGDEHATRDFGLAAVVKMSLRGEEGADSARQVCANLRARLDDVRRAPRDIDDTLDALFKVQPAIALSAFLLGDQPLANHHLLSFGFHRTPPTEGVAVETLRGWADQDPAVRYAALSRSLSLFVRNNMDETGELSPLFVDLLQTAPDKAAFLGEPWSRLHPRSYNGSPYHVLSQRKAAVETLLEDPDVAAWYEYARPQLDAWLAQAQLREAAQEESFE